MRCDQFAGLNKVGRELIEANKRHLHTIQSKILNLDGKVTVLPDAPIVDIPHEVYSHFSGMFEDEYPLYIYTFSGGQQVREVLQAAPWSSGPVHFLNLEEKVNGKWVTMQETLWSETEINNA